MPHDIDPTHQAQDTFFKTTRFVHSLTQTQLDTGAPESIHVTYKASGFAGLLALRFAERLSISAARKGWAVAGQQAQHDGQGHCSQLLQNWAISSLQERQEWRQTSSAAKLSQTAHVNGCAA